jgi:CheY-like chemotaxis protein
MRILIAEDNAVNLKLLRVMLNAEGLETLEASDGVQALALLREHRVDAIISDILMPNMDGYRLCHEVRRSPEWHHLPFIFYTSTYDSGEDEKVALNMGADRFLRKPQPVRVIIQALQEIVSAGPRTFEPIGPAHEAELMKEYSERLVYKLEEQIAELRERSAQLAAEVTERKRAERRAEESLALTQRSGQALLRRIEEQEQAELALRESEQNLRLALEAAQMGTFDWDIPRKSTQVVALARADVGLRPRRVPGKLRGLLRTRAPGGPAPRQGAHRRLHRHARDVPNGVPPGVARWQPSLDSGPRGVHL